MYEYLDLIFDGNSRKSNLVNIIIGKLEDLNRSDLVLRLGLWYRSQLHQSKIDDYHSRSILLSLSHAYFLKGNFEKRKEICIEVKSLKRNYFYSLNDLLIDKDLIHSDFCMGNWQRTIVRLRKIYRKQECIFNEPAKIEVGNYFETYEGALKDVKDLASLGMQETLQAASFVYDVLGNVDKAIDCLEQAIQLSEAKHGKRHINTASYSQDLADLYLKTGQIEKARKLSTLVLAIRKKYMPSYSLSLANSYMSMGKVHVELKEFDQAKLCLDKAMKVYSRFDKLGGLINMPLLKEEMARLAYAKGEYSKCEELVSEAILLYKRHFTAGHAVSVEALKLKIACLKAQNKQEEASEVQSTLTNILLRYKMDSDRVKFERTKAA